MRNRTMFQPAIVIMLCALATGAFAQHQPDRDRALRRDQHLRLDQRYHHDQYYPSRGTIVSSLPRGTISIGFGGDSFYFQGGVWFQSRRGRFIVGLPPLGITLPILPPAFATVWIGGLPYYYASDVYYVRSSGPGYTVVAPPSGAETAQVVPAPLPEPIVYPRNGQSAAQTEADRQECNRWATTQAGALADAQVFQRATEACLDGRGYTVR